MTRDATGTTLLELMVVLTILAITAGIAGLALRSIDAPDAAAERVAEVARARRKALESRRTVHIAVRLRDGRHADVWALPDGRVVADSLLAIDPLDGRPNAAR